MPYISAPEEKVTFKRLLSEVYKKYSNFDDTYFKGKY